MASEALRQDDVAESGFVYNGLPPSLYRPDNREPTRELPRGVGIRLRSKVEPPATTRSQR